MNRLRWFACVALVPFACDESSNDTPVIPGFDASVIGFDGGSGSLPDGSGPLSGGDGGIDCPTPTGGPTQHSGGVTDETWTADKSPHVLPSDVTVYGTLTL